MNQYRYDGPVMSFENCIRKEWTALTYAVSEQKARSNFSFQFKKEFGLRTSSRITLPGKITIV